MTGSTPAELDQDFARELNRGDLDGLLASYDERAVHIRQDGTLARGLQEIREVLEQFIEMRPRLDLEVTNVIPLDEDSAAVLDRWTLSATATEGGVLELNGTGIHLVRRQADGTWRFVATRLANLIPPAA